MNCGRGLSATIGLKDIIGASKNNKQTQCSCVKFDFDCKNLEKTPSCVLCFFSCSFTAYDGPEESTAGHVVSTCSIMVHHGYRSKEARRARRKK